jgi:hypothetical protein
MVFMVVPKGVNLNRAKEELDRIDRIFKIHRMMETLKCPCLLNNPVNPENPVNPV